MRIERLEYRDSAADWWLSGADFYPDLTLFVGHSESDKRRILAAIDTLARFAGGQTPDELGGVAWEMRFATATGRYLWQGELSGHDFSLREGVRKESFFKLLLPRTLQRGVESVVLRETLLRDDRLLVERKGEAVYCKGRDVGDHCPSKSALWHLRDDEDVGAAFDGFRRVVVAQDTGDALAHLAKPVRQLCKEFPTLDAVRDSNLSTYAKLAVVHETAADVFRAIVRSVREHLPQVEDVGFDRVNRSRFTDVPALRLLEKGSDQWLSESKITTARLQALLNLAAVVLWPDDAIVLVDAFEHNLGICCLEPVLAAARDPSRHLQFVLTSDDPAVIHRVGRERRKVATWAGSVVYTDDSSEFEVRKSGSTAVTAPDGVGRPRLRKQTDITTPGDGVSAPPTENRTPEL